MEILNACAGLLLFIVALPYVLKPVFEITIWFAERRIKQLNRLIEQEQQLELKQMLKRLKI